MQGDAVDDFPAWYGNAAADGLFVLNTIPSSSVIPYSEP